MKQASSAEFDLLATRHLSGEATGREKQRMREYLKTREWSARFAQLQQVWAATGVKPSVRFDPEAAAGRLAAAIAAQPTMMAEQPAAKPKANRSRRRTLRTAKKPSTRRRKSALRS